MTSVAAILASDAIPKKLYQPMLAICEVAAQLSRTIARGELSGSLGHEVGSNTDGDNQKALDVIADEAFAEGLRGTGVRWYASEEREEVVEIDVDGGFGVAIDPLDGSSNIDVNVSIGTIFSFVEALEDPDDTFLRSGTHQIGGGYVIYGPQTALVVSFGDGVQHYILDPDTGTFVLINPSVEIPETSIEFAINASNYRHWSKPIRTYIDDCLAGEAGPRGKNFNMRWVASLVAETHRILMRGGIFLYPSDERQGYENGRLRLLYECAPIALLVEQAGGRATDGSARILDRAPDSLHVRVPFVFGTPAKVERVAVYHDLPTQENSAFRGSNESPQIKS